MNYLTHAHKHESTFWCHVFHSCVFHSCVFHYRVFSPCCLVPSFPFSRFQSLRYWIKELKHHRRYLKSPGAFVSRELHLVYLLSGDQTNSKNSRTVSPREIGGGNCRIFYTHKLHWMYYLLLSDLPVIGPMRPYMLHFQYIGAIYSSPLSFQRYTFMPWSCLTLLIP